MQGRLCPLMDGKIQAFPWPYWREEFATAQRCRFELMEWTLDQDRLHENPLMTRAGRDDIRALVQRHNVTIGSLTGDCFMQAPFYKAEGAARTALLRDLDAVQAACAALGIRDIVFPLVDNGSLESREQEDVLRAGLLRMAPVLRASGTRIAFESDYAPPRLRAFIDTLPAGEFGINYDIGNSAALGFDAGEEIGAYGDRILNVHVKDRLRGGTTVPLGTGNADLPRVFRLLKAAGYAGNYVLQTARARDGDHAGVLCRYRDMVVAWLSAAV